MGRRERRAREAAERRGDVTGFVPSTKGTLHAIASAITRARAVPPGYAVLVVVAKKTGPNEGVIDLSVGTLPPQSVEMTRALLLVAAEGLAQPHKVSDLTVPVPSPSGEGFDA
jgi:hypothetical protein